MGLQPRLQTLPPLTELSAPSHKGPEPVAESSVGNKRNPRWSLHRESAFILLPRANCNNRLSLPNSHIRAREMAELRKVSAVANGEGQAVPEGCEGGAVKQSEGGLEDVEAHEYVTTEGATENGGGQGPPEHEYALRTENSQPAAAKKGGSDEKPSDGSEAEPKDPKKYIEPHMLARLEPAFVDYYLNVMLKNPINQDVTIPEIRANPEKFRSALAMDTSKEPGVSDYEVTSADGEKIMARLYLPDSSQHGAGPYPVHLNFHGEQRDQIPGASTTR